MTTGSAHRFDVFRQAEHTAHDWLAAVTRQLGTEDQHRAYRVARAWLHTVRDRLPVETTVHFAAQLPLTWRGLFYDGWRPHEVPVKYGTEQFLLTFAQDADLTLPEAGAAAGAVTRALAELTSDDLIGHLLAALPGELRQVLLPEKGRHLPGGGEPAHEPARAPAPRRPVAGETAARPLDARIARLEDDVAVITDALAALVDALDQPPSTEPDSSRSAGGVRRAHQILLSRLSPARPGTG